MIISILYVIMSILGLSFLIFIHELGHYWMARRTGMRVETFSIGFGRPITSWMRDGVKWQIGWLLFGGYVKIAGQDVENKDVDPYSIPDGFFGKSPWDRIKVAIMGPVANLVFALIAFTALYAIGGREKNFAEYTHVIGWVDPKSELYAAGIRPGDLIESYDGHNYESVKEHIYSPMTAGDLINVKGFKVNYATGERVPFDLNVTPYQHPASLEKEARTAGILNPGSYIIYDKLPGGLENPLSEGSPLAGSGIQYGDRVIWVDGELIFSQAELAKILNEKRVLLTIQRGDKTLLRRVPRVMAEEFKLEGEFKEELVDWQFEAKLQGTKLQKLYTIPYNLNNEGVVENPLKLIDKETQTDLFPTHTLSTLEEPLEPGDKIIAIAGAPITRSFELLKAIQEPSVLVIIDRDTASLDKIPFQEVDENFDKEFDLKNINAIASTIGTAHPVDHAGNFYLLKPIQPKTRNQLLASAEKTAQMNEELSAQKKEVEAIPDPDQKERALKILAGREKEVFLGLPAVQDRKINYNPGPFAMFGSVIEEIGRILSNLFTGSMNPKFLSGPIGIVQAVHDYSMVSIREALYWLGAISLNLGMINLLPIPVLDGGTIALNLVELVTRRRISPKLLELIVIPFAVLLIVLFIYITYNDLTRLIGGFFR